MRSIRQRLLILLFAAWTTIWLAVALITLERSHHEIAEFFDAELAQTAQMLLEIHTAGMLPDLVREPLEPPSPIAHPYDHRVAFQLCRGGALIARCCGAPDRALAEIAGFSDQDVAGARWRVFGLPTATPDEMLFVGQSYAIRDELIGFLTTQALQPALWSLPLSLLLIWFAVTDGLRPLGRLARDIKRRSPQQLAAVDTETVPSEIRPLTDALNELMGRLRETLAAERRFAADASHELRTPLAIIKTNAQIAQRSRDPGDREEALDRLVQGVDRASHLVSQLLLLARLQSDALTAEGETGSLVAAASLVVEDLRAEALAKSLTLETTLPEDDAARVDVPPALLEILVQNLISNSVKFTPEAGRVEVRVTPDTDRVVLQVADTGPGIPEAERERVFGRFHRLAGQTIPGAGLGLSIVKRICDLFGAEIDLRAGMGGRGLLAEVRFRRPPLDRL